MKNQWIYPKITENSILLQIFSFYDLPAEFQPQEWKKKDEINRLLKDAKLLEETGCFAIVIEKVPSALAKEIAKSVSIPIIGIGAGNDVDGQVLVLHDMLGMIQEFNPRFLRRYLNLSDDITSAVQNYVADVKSKNFPNEKEQY